MRTAWSGESGLTKAAAGFAGLALVSMAVWGVSLYCIHGDGDTYPGGVLGVLAVMGVGGTAVAVGGLLVVCSIGLVGLMKRAFLARGEE